MAIYESTDSLHLRNLIEEIDEGRTGLPDFQRSYVWKPAQVEELLASVCQDFPIGAVLRVRNGRNLKLGELRGFEGAPPLQQTQSDVEYVVLDGQQRLTSLYCALTGNGPHRFYLRLDAYRDSGDLAECITSSHASRRLARELEDPVAQYERLMLPFSAFQRFGDWKLEARHYLQQHGMSSPEALELERFLEQVQRDVVSNVFNYRIPVLTLSRDVTLDAVCTIFETINRTGTRLSLFDLLTARFRIDNIFLREEWEVAQRNYPELEQYEIDPFHLLRAIAAIVSRGHTVTRQDVLDLTGEDFRHFWNKVAEEMAWVLRVFRDDCGLVSSKWMPYDPMIVAPTAALVDFGALDHSMRGSVRQKLRQWFFASALSSRYEHGATSRIAQDFRELSRWFGGDPTPQWICDLALDPDTFSAAVSLQSAAYKAVLCFYLTQRPRDLVTGEPIERSVVRAGDVQDHHVFPRAFVRKMFPNTSLDVDTVFNRILIDGTTNRRIGSKPPSTYLRAIREGLIEHGVSPRRLDDMLESHLLPGFGADVFQQDDFEQFIRMRQQRVIDALNALVHGREAPVAV